MVNQRIRTELRLIAPYVRATIICEIVVAISSRFLDRFGQTSAANNIAWIVTLVGAGFIPIFASAIALQSFVTEFQDFTIGKLLTQPIHRGRIYIEKLLISTAALLIVASIGILLLATSAWSVKEFNNFKALAYYLVASAVAMATAGPLFVLFVKRGLGAMLLMLLCLVICWASRLFRPYDMNVVFGSESISTLLLFAFAALLVGYYRFLKMEVR